MDAGGTVIRLLAILLILAPSVAMGATFHFCKCDTGADADCEAGNDTTGDGSESTPYLYWAADDTVPSPSNAAQALAIDEVSFGAGDSIALCKGGYWDVRNPTSRWTNTACSAALPTAVNNCHLTDYTPPWASGDEGMPVVHQTQYNGSQLTLDASLVTDNVTSITITEACPTSYKTSGAYSAIYLEDDAGWFRRLSISTSQGGSCSGTGPSTITFGSVSGNDNDFSTGTGNSEATAGNTVWLWADDATDPDPTLMIFDGNGNQDTQTEGWNISNIWFKGPLIWSEFNTQAGTGIYLLGDRDDFTLTNVKISGFNKGMNVRYNTDTTGGGTENMERLTITGSEFFNNAGAGILGITTFMLFDGNNVHDNAGETILDHNAYFGRLGDDSTISKNTFGPSNQGTRGSGCGGVNVIAHNSSARVLFEGNTFALPSDEATGGCWAIGIDGGNSNPEEFVDWIFRGNVIVGFDRGIALASAVNTIIENNLIINTDTQGVNFRAIDTESGNGQFSGACEPSNCDTPSTNTTTRNNTIVYANSGSSGTAIDVGTQGSSHDILSNAIYYAGTNTAFNCLGGSTTTAPYGTVDNNVCYRPNATTDWMDGVGSLATWQAVSGAPDPNSVETDPGLTDVSGSVFADFDLSASSPDSIMIDAGHASSAATARGYLNRDASPDIGAYEYLVATPGDNLDSGIGMNLEWNRYEKPRVAFQNAMKSGRIWQNAATTCGTSTGNYAGSLTATGYPTAIAGDCIFTALFSGAYADGAWPLGTWTLEWTGSATMAVGGAASGISGGGTTSPATFTVDSTTGGFWVGIDSMTTQVSDMRIYPPGGVCKVTATGAIEASNFCDTGTCPSGDCPEAVASCGAGKTCEAFTTAPSTFHPLWLSRLGQYHTLRFMNWLHINHSQVTDYSEWRPEGWYTYEYAHLSGIVGNVPLATIADLCNEANAACYVNVPVQATDAHITSFAQFFRDNVNSWLPVYLEFSNEVWNPGFQQHEDAADAAYAADGANFDGAACNPATRSAAMEAECARHWHAKRTYEMCGLAQAAFDATGQGDQLVCVFGDRVSLTGTDFAEKLDCSRWTAAPSGNCYTGSDIDAVAINVYLGGAGDCTAGMTMQEACDAAALDIPIKLCDGAGCPIQEMNDELVSRSLTWRMMIYEGGSSMEDSSVAGCVEMTTSPDSCVGDVYAQALDQWKTLDATYNLGEYIFFDNSGRQWSGAGGNLFGHRGSNELDWPKEAALMSWDNTSGNDCWWTGCTLATEAPGGGVTTLFGPWRLAP